jgi:hypothetical protein
MGRSISENGCGSKTGIDELVAVVVVGEGAGVVDKKLRFLVFWFGGH